MTQYEEIKKDWEVFMVSSDTYKEESFAESVAGNTVRAYQEATGFHAGHIAGQNLVLDKIKKLLNWTDGTEEQILAYIEGLVIGQKSFEEELATYRVDNYIKGENLETLKKQLEEARKVPTVEEIFAIIDSHIYTTHFGVAGEKQAAEAIHRLIAKSEEPV